MQKLVNVRSNTDKINKMEGKKAISFYEDKQSKKNINADLATKSYINEIEKQNETLKNNQFKLITLLNDFTQLFESSPVSYFILDKDCVILSANNTAARQLCIDKKQLIGRHLSTFLSTRSYRDDYMRYKEMVMKTGKNLHFECEIKRNDDTQFFALFDSTMVTDEKSNFKHFFLILSDITEQKEQEHKIALALLKEMELNEMKSQFIKIASHEFRTPLNTILTSSELIEKYSESQDAIKREKHFGKIKASVQRIEEIMLDFMSANEIEKGKIQNNPETFEIDEFTINLMREIKKFDGTHHVSYEHIGNFRTVNLDKRLLTACMSNLLINAYKYSPNDTNIEIKTEQTVSGNIQISIKDMGIGIPEKEQVNICKQFYRARNVENIQGTGLGLSIAKKLLAIMGGTLSFDSRENKGSTFYIKFSHAK